MKKKHLLIFFASSALITAVLFKGGNILGGGESGAPFYDISRMYEDSKSPWLDGFLGVYIPQAVANIPFLWIFSSLAGSGVSGVLLQAMFTFGSIFISLVSFYLFAKEVFGGYRDRAYLLSSFFYLFNFYSVMDIWNRFLLNFILFYSVLPLFLWLFLRFLRRERFIYLGLFLMSSFILSYAFSSPAHIVVLWAILLFITILEVRAFGQLLRKLLMFISSVVSWFVVNYWWVSQQLKFGVSESFGIIVAERFSGTGNSIGLASLSDALGKLENLYLLKHGIFYNETPSFVNNWPALYKHPILLLLEWVVLLMVLYWAIKRRKKIPVVLSLGLFLGGIFLAKGVASPFGEIFNFFFSKFTFIQFFRNPFEKLGIVAAIGISLMLGPAFLDTENIFRTQSRFLKRFVSIFLIAYVIFFLGYPFWSGLVFTGSRYPFNDPSQGYQVVVPDYYSKADEWLEAEAKDGRFITFPLGGEGIEYRWPKGYLGVEESQILFNNQSISNIITFPFYEQVSSSVQRLFSQHVDFFRVASLLNTQYILLRPDIDFRNSGMKDPAYMQKILSDRVDNVDSRLSFAHEFGPLKFYKYSDDVMLPKVYASNNLISAANSDLELYLMAGGENRDVMYQEPAPDQLEEYTEMYVLKNNSTFRLGGTYPTLTNAPHIFPYVSHTPSYRFYSLVLLKERLQRAFDQNVESRLNWDILILGKRLKEAENAAMQGDVNAARIALDLYEDQLLEVLAGIHSFSLSIKAPHEQVWNEGTMVVTFNSHLFILNELEDNDKINVNGYVTNLKARFLKKVSEEKIIPRYEPVVTDNFPLKDRIVYNFTVSSPGEYELFIPASIFFPKDFALDGQTWIQIDDTLEYRQIRVQDNKISFGNFRLDEGVHEISLNLSPLVNLVDSTGFELNANGQDATIILRVNKYSPYSQYLISFDYLINYGEGPRFLVSLNNDNIVEEDGNSVQQYHFSENLAPEDYFFGNKNYSIVIHPDLSSDEMELILKLSPWNNCRKIFFRQPSKCDNPVVSKPFERPSRVEITNFKLTPEYPKGLFALMTKEGVDRVLPEVNFEKISPTYYKVNVNEIYDPFILVFSELFDRGWKAYIGGRTIAEKNHFLVNSYANGWFIDGPEVALDIELRFEPHFALDKAFLVSLVTFGIVATVTVALLFRKKL